jgi:hypothetical protein
MSIELTIIAVVIILNLSFMSFLLYKLLTRAPAPPSIDINDLLNPHQPAEWQMVEKKSTHPFKKPRKQQEVPLPDPADLLRDVPKASGFGSKSGEKSE